MSATARGILLVSTAVLVALLAWLDVSADLRAGDADDGPAAAAGLDWREVLAWDFADGEFPDGWGWGDRGLVDGTLELRDPDGSIAVYFTPVAHAPDFMLVTEFMFVADAAGGPASVHLLTRDANIMTHESGCVLRAGRDSMSVRHKVNRHEYLLDVVPIPVRPEPGRWHRLRFTVARGIVSVHLDGKPILAGSGPYPQGLYTEPHVAAENGVVRFRSIEVLEAAPGRGGPFPLAAVRGRHAG